MFQKIAKHRANDASNDVHRPPLLVSLHDIYLPVEILCVDVPFPDPKLSYCKPLPLYKPIFYFFNVT